MNPFAKLIVDFVEDYKAGAAAAREEAAARMAAAREDAAARVVAMRAAAAAKASPSPPRLDARAESKFDGEGERCEVTIDTPLPPNCVAEICLVDQDHCFVKALPPYSDKDGNYLWFARIRDGKCSFYIPFGAVRAVAGRSYSLVIHAVPEGRNGPSMGRASFTQDLPVRTGWSYAAHCLPMIRLLMYVAMADGALSQAAVGLVRSICREELDLAPDSDDLRSALKQARSDVEGASCATVALWAVTLHVRFGPPHLSDFAASLLRLARVDGPVSPRRLAAMQEVLKALGNDEESWREFVKREKLDDSEHLTTLELTPGATIEEIKTAYRRLIQQYHPDRFAQSPVEFQNLAQQRSIQLRDAYEALVAKTR